MSDYVHGYSKKEQDRLYKQAEILEPIIYDGIDFDEQEKLLEIGCGVGAQTRILARRFPWLNITSIDHSKVQIDRAKKELKKLNKVQFQVAKGHKLSYKEATFDSVFLCWVLEHMKDHLGLLKEAHRVLSKNGKIYCNEVHNATFFIEPYHPAILQYWFQFNDFQFLSGDPFVGAKLANLLLQIGFKNVETEVKTFHLDSRKPKTRAKILDYWLDLMMSAAPILLENKRITPELLRQVQREFKIVKAEKNSVFYYSFIQAVAYK